MDANGLPFLASSHDTMRLGLSSLKEDVAVMKHPVELIQRDAKSQAERSRMQMQRNVYGLAVPAKVSIETQILSRFQRLPGVPSSMLGLESLTGDLDDFGFESFIGLPEYSEVPEPELHAVMEQRLKLGTAPVTRAFF